MTVATGCATDPAPPDAGAPPARSPICDGVTHEWLVATVGCDVCVVAQCGEGWQSVACSACSSFGDAPLNPGDLCAPIPGLDAGP